MTTESKAVSEVEPKAAAADPISRLEALERENENFRSWGIIEVAVRNPNVSEYMDHWEGRTTKAEAALTAAQAEIETLRRENEHLRTYSTGDWASQRDNDALTIQKYKWKDRAETAEAEAATLRARVAELLSRQEWQPIETVPKHRSVILAFTWKATDEHPSYEGSPYVAEGYLDWDGATWRFQRGEPVTEHNPPTHWMPIPTPPAAQPKEAGDAAGRAALAAALGKREG